MRGYKKVPDKWIKNYFLLLFANSIVGECR